jgi:hypothetical protein
MYPPLKSAKIGRPTGGYMHPPFLSTFPVTHRLAARFWVIIGPGFANTGFITYPQAPQAKSAEGFLTPVARLAVLPQVTSWVPHTLSRSGEPTSDFGLISASVEI